MVAERTALISTKLHERIDRAYKELAEAHDQDNQNDIIYWTTTWGEDWGEQFCKETIWPVKDQIYKLEGLIVRLSFRLSLVSDYQPLPLDYFWR